MSPDRLPERYPPRLANGSGLFRHNAGAHGGPEARPIRLGHRGGGLTNQRTQASQLLEGGATGGAVGKMCGDQASRAGSESAVGMALETASNHCAPHAPHGRQYTSTSLDVGPPLIICAGNLKVVSWKRLQHLTFVTAAGSTPASRCPAALGPALSSATPTPSTAGTWTTPWSSAPPRSPRVWAWRPSASTSGGWAGRRASTAEGRRSRTTS